MKISKIFIPIIFLSCLNLFCLPSYAKGYDFKKYKIPVIKIITPKMPNFKNRDKNFSTYRSRIREIVAKGVNFSGHYSAVIIAEGTAMTLGYIVDLQNGKVFEAPDSVFQWSDITIKFVADSSLYVVKFPRRTNGYECVEEQYIWKNDKFILKSKRNYENKHNIQYEYQCDIENKK